MAHNKRGLLNLRDLTDAVTEFKDMREESDLDSAMVEEEIRRLNASMMRCDIDPVGGVSLEKQQGRIWVFFGQLNNVSTKSVRDVKVKGLKFIEKKYDTDIHIYNEHGINGSNLRRGSTFDGLMSDSGRSKYIFAYNRHDTEYQGVHQPWGGLQSE